MPSRAATCGYTNRGLLSSSVIGQLHSRARAHIGRVHGEIEGGDAAEGEWGLMCECSILGVGGALSCGLFWLDIGGAVLCEYLAWRRRGVHWL